MHAEQQENGQVHDSPTQESLISADELLRQQQAIARTEAGLQEQRQTLLQMMEDLKQLQNQMRGGPPNARPAEAYLSPEMVEQLRHQNEQLRQAAAQAEELRQENDQLRQLIDALEASQLAAEEKAKEAGPSDEEVNYLHEQNDMLRKMVKEKEKAVRKLEKQLEAKEETPVIDDVDSYEAELVQFRRELEADRANLNEEIAMIRGRNKELEDAIREMEMEMSKERAELARERTRLERLQIEVQSEIQRMEKNAGINHQMANVQRLRQQMAQR